jgi:hypothetical protein
MPAMRVFSHGINGKLELDKDEVPPTQRKNDSHSMDHVLRSSKFKDWKADWLTASECTSNAPRFWTSRWLMGSKQTKE